MQVPLVDLKAQHLSLRKEIDTALKRVIGHSGFILGQEVSDFENAFRQYIGSESAVGVASGTAALQLSFMACGIAPGDEVITSPHSFFATAEAISLTGARPVFVDIDPRTYTLDPERLEDAITARTRAVVPVHIYGHPADMSRICAIAQRHSLYVVEDAAQAHGASQAGRRCGTYGHLSCFSFFPGKNLGALGDAGAVSGRDPELLGRVRMLRNHGRISKYEHSKIGMGERLDAMQAAVLLAKLPHLERWTELRRSHAAEYSRLLANSGVGLPHEAADCRHVYHLYVIRSKKRDALLGYLKGKGIEAGVHYPIPIHRQPAYTESGYQNVSLPVSEQACQEVLSLPMYPEMSQEQLEYVAHSVLEFA
jgi:dTDP-4-amino-4,6-dideoxygalactose transaminase